MRLVSTYSQVGSTLYACKGVHWWQLNGSPTRHELDVASTSSVVSWFSCWVLCTWIEHTYPEFWLMANISMSVVITSSNLDDQKSGVVTHREGPTLTPMSGWNGLEEIEAFGSTSSHSPSWSPVRNQIYDCPETWYCLEIQVISTKYGELHHHPTHLAGASCERHALRWQIWPNRSSNDGPRPGHPVLWKVIFRRRTELELGMRCHVHAIRGHQLGW